MKYLTTDPQSRLPLAKGVNYFMDFKADPAHSSFWEMAFYPLTSVYSWFATPTEKVVKEDQIKTQFIADMRERGHELEGVVIETPEPDMIRIRFRIMNPLPLLIVIAAASAIVIVGVGIAMMFVGFGEMPGKTIAPIFQSIVENPIPVIAIIIGVGIFIMGRKL